MLRDLGFTTLPLRATHLALLGALVGLFPSTLSATSVMPFSFDRLCKVSGNIFAGTVASMSESIEDGGRIPVTHVRFVNVRAIKGDIGRQVTIHLAGGTVNGRSVTLEGQPTFSKGERYIIFSVADFGSSANMFVPILGVYQGFFPLRREREAGAFVVHDWNGRPITRISKGSVFVVGSSSAVHHRFMRVVPANEDTGRRLSEDDFIGHVRSTLESSQ